MTTYKFDLSRLFIGIDSCKNCGVTYFECKNCRMNEFYRHIDDKIKMKSNMKTIRSKGLYPYN